MLKRLKERWLSITLISLLVVLVALKLLVVDLYTIPQEGMYPTIQQGGRFLALKRPFQDPSSVRRGDIIVFVRQVEGKPYNFVWRVVGLPGDRVEIVGEAVRVNGQELPHQMARKNGNLTIYVETNGEAAYEVAYRNDVPRKASSVAVTVVAGEVFVLGDNRDAAGDSRFHGTVPFGSIIARKIPR